MAGTGGDRVIVHLLSVLDRGGLEVRMLEVLSALDLRGLRVVVCTLSGRRGELARAYEAAGAEVHPMRLSSPAFAWRLWRLMRGLRAEVVASHLHYSSGPMLALAWLAGVPTRIAHFHSDSHGHAHASRLRLAYYAVAKWLILRAATDVVGVAPSSLSANWSEVARNDPRFRILPNGVDLDRIAPPQTATLRSELGVATKSPLIVHIGRADIPTKNRELAVDVLRCAIDAGLGATLAFVGRHGDDPESVARHDRLLARIEDYGLAGRVIIAGERSDIGAILHESDVLLSTSKLEGLPGSVLEACACGLPVVSSDVPGAVFIAEQLDGVTIVSQDSPPDHWVEALVEALKRAGKDEREARRKQFAASAFSLESLLCGYQELWRC